MWKCVPVIMARHEKINYDKIAIERFRLCPIFPTFTSRSLTTLQEFASLCGLAWESGWVPGIIPEVLNTVLNTHNPEICPDKPDNLKINGFFELEKCNLHSFSRAPIHSKSKPVDWTTIFVDEPLTFLGETTFSLTNLFRVVPNTLDMLKWQDG